jgi:Ser/Thr protein kinase RdoA (MazF antagonist)
MEDGKHNLSGPDAPLIYYNMGVGLAELHRALKLIECNDIERLDFCSRIFEKWVPEIAEAYTDTERLKFLDVMENLKKEIVKVLTDLPEQPLHGDCHLGNILLYNNKVSGFIDFDVACRGPRMYDLAFLATHLVKFATMDERVIACWLRNLNRMIAGYNSVNSFSEREIAAVWHLMIAAQLRFVHSSRFGNAEAVKIQLKPFYWFIDKKKEILQAVRPSSDVRRDRYKKRTPKLAPITIPITNAHTFHTFNLSLETAGNICSVHELASPVTIHRIPRGEVSAVFELNLVDRSKLILKACVRTQDATLLQRERTVISYLSQHSDIPLPKWLVMSPGISALPCPHVIMERTGGIDADILWKQLNLSQREELILKCGKTLSSLHKVQPPRTMLNWLESMCSVKSWADNENKQFKKGVSELRSQNWLDKHLLMRAETVWERNRELLEVDFQPAFVHYDFQLHNLRVDHDSLDIIALLDFGNVSIGPGILDARDLELCIFLNSPLLRKEFWQGYGLQTLNTQVLRRVWLNALKRSLHIIAAYCGPAPSGVGTETVQQLLSLLEEAS